MFRVYDANDDGYVDFVEFMVHTFLYCICHCICVVYDGYADFVYLSDGTLCSDDLLHYERWLSRGGLGQNLPRL